MITPALALNTIPPNFRDPLIASYGEIARNFAEHRWEPAELNGGKFCEVVYCNLEGLNGVYAAAGPYKPANMVNACRALEGRPANPRSGDRSLRILIPRMLPVLYEIRNNRGVGHIGGDVSPNFQDSVAVFQMASWVMAELVRILHQTSLAEAQETVDALVERKHPIVWQEGEMRRVLDPTLSKADQSLLLLYSANGWVGEEILANWVEYGNLTQYRNRIILPFHKDRLLEYDAGQRRLKLTPLGLAYTESKLLPNYKL